MLNDLTIFIKPEDINPGIFLISGPYLMAVEDDMVALCKCTIECNFLAGMLGSHALKILDERRLAVCYLGIVLDVFCASIALYRLTRLALIKHQVIEGFGGCFILFQVLHRATLSPAKGVDQPIKVSDPGLHALIPFAIRSCPFYTA